MRGNSHSSNWNTIKKGVYLQTLAVVQVTMSVSKTVAEFDNAAQTSFISNLALLLGIDVNTIRIVSVSATRRLAGETEASAEKRRLSGINVDFQIVEPAPVLEASVTAANDVVESAGSVSATASVPASIASSDSSSSGSSSSGSSSSGSTQNATLNGTIGVPMTDAEKTAAHSESYQYQAQLVAAAATLSQAAASGNLSTALGMNVTVESLDAPVVPDIPQPTKNCTINATTQAFECTCLQGYWGLTCDKTCDHCTGTG